MKNIFKSILASALLLSSTANAQRVVLDFEKMCNDPDRGCFAPSTSAQVNKKLLQESLQAVGESVPEVVCNLVAGAAKPVCKAIGVGASVPGEVLNYRKNTYRSR